MTQKHTPGPWAVSKNSSGRRVTSTTGIVICNAVLRNTGRADRGNRHGTKEHKEAEANARLIAAAPCMLTAIARYLAARKALDAAPTHNGPAFDAAMDEHDAALAELSRVATLARGETA